MLFCIGSPYWDFDPINLSFSLSKYKTRHCVSISIVHDYIHEDDESLHLMLSRHSSLPSYVRTTPAISTINVINVKSKLSFVKLVHQLYFVLFSDNFSLGFDLARIKVRENAGSVDICISSSIDNFQNGRITLQVVIPMCHENGK